MDRTSQSENSSEQDLETEELIFGEKTARMSQSDYNAEDVISEENKQPPAESDSTKEVPVVKEEEEEEEEHARAAVEVQTPGPEDTEEEEDKKSRTEAESCAGSKKTEQEIFVESDTVVTNVNSEASATNSDAKAWEQTNGNQSDVDPEKKLTGVVVKWIANRGYGFIKTPNNRDYFFHASDILPITRNQLNLNENVEFYLVELEEGKTRAVKVRGDGTGEKVVWATSQDFSNFQAPRNKKWKEHQNKEYHKSQGRENNYYGNKNRRSRRSYERNSNQRRSGQRQLSNDNSRSMYIEVTPEQMSLWRVFCSTYRELGLSTSNMVTQIPQGAMVFKSPYIQAPSSTVAGQPAGPWQTNQQPRSTNAPMPHSIPSSMLPNPAYSSTVHLNTMAQLLQTLTAGQSVANANYGIDNTSTLDSLNYLRSSTYDEPYGYRSTVSGTYQEFPPLHDSVPVYNQYMDSSIPEPITMHAGYPELSHFRGNDSIDPKPRNTGSSSSGWHSYTQPEPPINPYIN